MKTEPPPIGEPSLLDFIKSRLKFWDHGEKIALPVEPAVAVEGTVTPVIVAEAEPVIVQTPQVAVVELPKQKSLWPWRSLIALALALLAQRSWEPAPNRTATMGLVFYAVSLGMLAWAYWSREWAPSQMPESTSRTDSLRIRLIPLIAGALIAVVAFLLLGKNKITPEGNLFTPLNVFCWVAAII